MNEEDAFACVMRLLLASGQKFFMQTEVATNASRLTLLALVKKHRVSTFYWFYFSLWANERAIIFIEMESLRNLCERRRHGVCAKISKFGAPTSSVLILLFWSRTDTAYFSTRDAARWFQFTRGINLRLFAAIDKRCGYPLHHCFTCETARVDRARHLKRAIYFCTLL